MSIDIDKLSIAIARHVYRGRLAFEDRRQIAALAICEALQGKDISIARLWHDACRAILREINKSEPYCILLLEETYDPTTKIETMLDYQKKLDKHQNPETFILALYGESGREIGARLNLSAEGVSKRLKKG